MKTGSENLIFWGAGATASLGLRMTADQAKAILALVGRDNDNAQSLQQRVCEALKDSPEWQRMLEDLLLILGDESDGSDDIYRITEIARHAMRRHWTDQSAEALNKRIHELRALYDWSALREVVRICPGFPSNINEDISRLKMQDIFNVLDLHTTHGFPAGDNKFLPPSRLIAVRGALQMLINTLFYVDWQTALTNEDKQQELEKHLGFARLLAEHHQQVGVEKATRSQYYDNRDFYLGDIAFVSLNYDPVALWAQFIANWEANNNPPHIGIPRLPLKIFHDFGIFMAISTIDRKNKGNSEPKEHVWYPLNEASAQRLNDRDYCTRRVRFNKFFFPHGCLCWRECPSCGKLSSFMGKDWRIGSTALIPPPPLRGFTEQAKFDIPAENDSEQNAWDRGAVDARSCVHCAELTYACHTTTIMQSNFKPTPPSFIEEVQRDLRVATRAANHIILMGYSLPPDDVAYRAFLAARKKRATDPDQSLRCSVVVGKEWDDRWIYQHDIDAVIDKMPQGTSPRTTLEAARDIFGEDNVRFYGGGIPQIFCEGNQPSAQRLHELIHW